MWLEADQIKMKIEKEKLEIELSEVKQRNIALHTKIFDLEYNQRQYFESESWIFHGLLG